VKILKLKFLKLLLSLMLKGTFDKSVVKIPSILHYPKRFYEAKCVS